MERLVGKIEVYLTTVRIISELFGMQENFLSHQRNR